MAGTTPEPVRLGLCGDADEFLEPALCGGGVFERAGVQQRAELLFDVPRRLQRAGRVIYIEDVPEPVAAAVGERLAGSSGFVGKLIPG